MVGPGIQQETVKNMKNVKYTNRTWVMATKQKNVEKETQTLFQLEYCEKTEKTWKMKHKHSFTLNVSRKLKNMDDET